MNTKASDQILTQYEKKANEILFRMYQLLTRTQRKVEDKEYRKILQSIHN